MVGRVWMDIGGNQEMITLNVECRGFKTRFRGMIEVGEILELGQQVDEEEKGIQGVKGRVKGQNIFAFGNVPQGTTPLMKLQ